MKNDILRRFTIYGILFGFCFPIMALGLDMIVKEQSLSFETIGYLHSVNPIHWIIDTAPIILGGTAFLIGRWVAKNEEESQEVLEEELKKSKAISQFSQKLIAGDFEAEIDQSLEIDKEIKDSLLELKSSLIASKKKEEQEKWVGDGMTRFMELLKDNSGNEEFYDKILSGLVKYLGANQGGFYIVDEDEKGFFMTLKSCYAYDRKKHIDQRIYEGEGLLGTLLLEKAKVFMTDIPQNYTSITSGLGESTPTCLMIIPMLSNDRIVGAFEIASFQEIEDYKVSFVEKIAENLATTISSLKVNEETRKLLHETKAQSDDLKQKEEELRQNMEELSATQEQMLKNEQDYRDKISGLEIELKNFKN